jgi:hypothetical protein
MQTRKLSVALVAVALTTCWSVDAQEFTHEIMTGGRVNPSASSSAPVLAYGRDEPATFSPRSSLRARSPDVRTATYCVRSCDGRYFPAPSAEKSSIAEGCKNLCPASETQVFYGSSIDGAYSQKGQAYSALPNAFRYRKELVEGCTCNGKDVVGLARIKPEDDGTLRRGDMLATADGMKVVRRIVDGEPQLAATSSPISSR